MIYKVNGIYWSKVKDSYYDIHECLNTSDKKTAQDKEEELIEKYYPHHGRDTTVSELISWYLELYSQNKKHIKVFLRDMKLVENIGSHFGSMYANEVMPEEIEIYIKLQNEKGRKKAPVRRDVEFFEQAYKKGIEDWGIPATSPFDRMDLSKTINEIMDQNSNGQSVKIEH